MILLVSLYIGFVLLSGAIVVEMALRLPNERRIHAVREQAIWWEGNHPSKCNARTVHLDRDGENRGRKSFECRDSSSG